MKINYKFGPCNGDCGRDHVLIVQKSLGLCQWCNVKRLTKRYQEKRKEKVKAGTKASIPERYYKMVWHMNEKECFETGEPLYKYHKWHVHHVLHKEDYPELALKYEVCVLLSLQQHMLWHDLAPSDRPKKMPRTYERYLELCKQFNLTP